MTDWTEHDGYTLRNALRNHPELGDCDLVDACARAAAHIADLEEQLKEVHALAFSLGGKLDRATAHIEALEARVAELAEWKRGALCGNRDVLVSALRERAKEWRESMHAHLSADSRATMMNRAEENEHIADEIELGEWPKPKEGT